ncbi:MAG: hypothetical protein KGL44_06285 [Sphingomonadales bacterium]|nr:hypothetical protein [Sphingomonadales bacterium]
MIDFGTLANAMDFARNHAEEGLRKYPFDAVYKATLAQIDAISASLATNGLLSAHIAGGITLGLMAAKELGNDERDFAHALHVIQRYADDAKSKDGAKSEDG